MGSPGLSVHALGDAMGVEFTLTSSGGALAHPRIATAAATSDAVLVFALLEIDALAFSSRTGARANGEVRGMP